MHVTVRQVIERRDRSAHKKKSAMTFSACFASAAFIVALWSALAAAAQPPVPAPTPPAPQRRMDYPTRPPGDPAAIDRGKALYGVNCQFCHGADTRGGDGGPSLLRSSIVLADQSGEMIAPVVRAGRPGMPKFNFTDAQMADIAAFLHTFRAAGYDESRVKPPSIVVGDARAGEAFFNAKCGKCHSPTGDLRGLATKISEPRLLQQTWLMPGSGGGRGAPPPVDVAPVTVTVTLPSGEQINGRLDRMDDFTVALTQADGTRRSFRTRGDTPKVEVHDPLEPHRDLLKVYSDADIHNVTAFLVTLK
jgi:cytochrome c oxidase cbb3-type subunit III